MTVAIPALGPRTATYVPSARPWHILRSLVVGSRFPVAGGALFGCGPLVPPGPPPAPGRPVIPGSLPGLGL